MTHPSHHAKCTKKHLTLLILPPHKIFLLEVVKMLTLKNGYWLLYQQGDYIIYFLHVNVTILKAKEVQTINNCTRTIGILCVYWHIWITIHHTQHQGAVQQLLIFGCPVNTSWSLIRGAMLYSIPKMFAVTFVLRKLKIQCENTKPRWKNNQKIIIVFQDGHMY